ncbi:nuclear mitotic apparatus protein, partial [Thraustotheca clavata]
QVKQLLYSSTSTAAPGSEESLVVFRNIEELQVRNQQLLKIVRDLSDKPNASKVIATVEPEEDLVPWSQAQWEKVNAELQQLCEERLREQEMVAAVVKQRDMYRVLLSQADSRYIEAESKTPKSPRRQSLDLGSHDARLLRELRLEFEDYKKEKQQLVASLRDTVDSLRGEVSKAKVVAMEANVEAKANQEKFRLAELRKNEFEEELVRFRSKYEQCNALMLQHQATIANFSLQIDIKTEALQKLEIAHNSVSTERDYLKRQEERLTVEVTQLRLDSTNQLKLMDAVRRIESYQTDRTAQEVERLQAYSTSLEAQVAERQKALDDTTALASAKTAELTLELKNCQKLWDADKVSLQSLREARVGLEEQVRSLTKLCDVKSDEIQTLRAQLKKGAGVAAAERVSALETAIEDAKHELHAVLSAKQTAEQHAEQYKIIADAHEKSLAALSASSEKWKAEQEARLQAAILERDSAKEEMTKLQKKMLDNMVEENKLRQEMDAWDAKKRAEVHVMEERALLAEKSLEVAKKEVASLKERLAQEDGELQRVRDDYSRELQKHSAAVIVCNDLRREIDETRRAAKDQELLVAQLEMSLATVQNDHEKALLNLKNSVDEATAAKAALEEQNKLLHSQLEVLTQDINKEHEVTLLKSTQATESESDKQLRELRGVVTYLRREHEIAESKLELAKQEALRYQTTAKALEKTVDRLKAEQVAFIKMQSSALQTTEDQVKRSAQLDTLSLLRESNAMLREENEKNLKKVKEKDATIQSLEAKLSPLQHSEGLLKGQIQNLKEDIESLNKANKRWKNRVDQLIEKYQQIDPEEHEKVCSERNSLKEEVEALKNAAQEAAAELSKTQPKTEELEIRKKYLEERVEKLQVFVKNWKDRCIKAEARVSELEAATSEAEAKVKDGEKIIEEKIKVAELQAKKVLEEKIKLAEAEAKKALEVETEKNEKLTQFNSKLMAKVKTSAVQIAQLNEKLNAFENDKQASEESADAVVEQPPVTKPVIAVITKTEPAPVVALTPAVPQVVKAPEVAPAATIAQPATQNVQEAEKSAVEVPTPSPATKPTIAIAPQLPTDPKPVESEPAAAPATAPAASSDDALREMALKSLLRRKTPLLAVKKDAQPPLPSSPVKAASIPVATTTTAKLVVATTPSTTAAKPASALNPTAPVFTTGAKSLFGTTSPKTIPPLNLPATDAPATSSPSKTSNPFLNLMPPTAFGSSGATGLVFGGNTKITLPVPTLPAEGAEPETEEQRLQQRLQRFKRAATSAVENAPPSKKAATDDIEETKDGSKDKDGE